MDITDTWEPLEEGLNRLETTRHVSVITITLSTVPLDPTSIGYQAPLEEEFVKPLQESSGAGRGGGNGGMGSSRQTYALHVVSRWALSGPLFSSEQTYTAMQKRSLPCLALQD